MQNWYLIAKCLASYFKLDIAVVSWYAVDKSACICICVYRIMINNYSHEMKLYRPILYTTSSQFIYATRHQNHGWVWLYDLSHKGDIVLASRCISVMKVSGHIHMAMNNGALQNTKLQLHMNYCINFNVLLLNSFVTKALKY